MVFCLVIFLVLLRHTSHESWLALELGFRVAGHGAGSVELSLVAVAIFVLGVVCGVISELRCRGGGDHGHRYGRQVVLRHGWPVWPCPPALLAQRGARYWLENPSQGRPPVQRSLWDPDVIIAFCPSSSTSRCVSAATSGGGRRGILWTRQQVGLDGQHAEAAVLKERRSPRAARADARSYGGCGGGGGARGRTRGNEADDGRADHTCGRSGRVAQ